MNVYPFRFIPTRYLIHSRMPCLYISDCTFEDFISCSTNLQDKDRLNQHISRSVTGGNAVRALSYIPLHKHALKCERNLAGDNLNTQLVFLLFCIIDIIQPLIYATNIVFGTFVVCGIWIEISSVEKTFILASPFFQGNLNVGISKWVTSLEACIRVCRHLNSLLDWLTKLKKVNDEQIMILQFPN